MREISEGDLPSWPSSGRTPDHSDTTPALVELLGGEPGAPIESPEYDRLYIVSIGADGAISTDHVVKALASYVRTLVAPPSPFDAYVFDDDKSVMSPAALAGMTLFFSARLGCAQCHASLTLSGPISHAVTQAPPVFHVTAVSGSARAFRAPTLRMVRATAPYMHDGSLATLGDVIDHYQTAQLERVPAFSLSAAERTQLIAFLETL